MALIPTVVFSAALGIFFASVNVYLRDTQHLVTVIVGAAWFWACPIVYSYQHQVVKALTKHHLFGSVALKDVYFLNPMTPMVMSFQRVLYNRPGLVRTHAGNLIQILPGWSSLTYVWADAIVFGVALVLLYLAMVVFGRLAGNFAEEL